MPLKTKICGLTEKSQVETCLKYGVNMCGFIMFYKKSHRNLTIEKVKKLTDIKNAKSNVAVMVNPKDIQLEKIKNLNFQYFQIYGNQKPSRLKNIKKKFNVKIIKALQISSRKDILQYKKYENVADIFLLDSKGYERSLSWNHSFINEMPRHLNKMIAGNIKIEDLEKINKIADIVDVSGSLETNKKKDLNKIKKFLLKVKEINAKN